MSALAALILTSTLAATSADTGPERLSVRPAASAQAAATIVAPASGKGRIVKSKVELSEEDASRVLSLDLDWTTAHGTVAATRHDTVAINAKDNLCHRSGGLPDRSCVIAVRQDESGRLDSFYIAVPMATDYP